jgi:integrase
MKRIATAREIEAFIKRGKPGRVRAGDNLYAQIATTGTASWVARYQHNGKARGMGLGACSMVTLAQARESALAIRYKLKVEGVDPLAARQAEQGKARLAAAKAMTFEAAATVYIAAHEAGWRNEKHAQQWRNTLAQHAHPTIGALPVASIDTTLIMKVLEPIWTAIPETAGRVRSRIECVLDWAAARGHRTGPNPAAWRGHLDKLLPRRSKVAPVEHHPALPYRDLPAFMGSLRTRTGIAARALQFLILTATRSNEVLSAVWSEIDLATAVWTVPAERTKSGREHRVPLSAAAVALLKALPRIAGNEHVFPGARPGKGLDRSSMVEVLRSLKAGDATVHGFRSTFRDWASEMTAYPNEVAEMALAHVVADKTEAAYRRGDLIEKRALMMQDWSAYGASIPRDAGDVVPIRGAAS